jgi:hypothetical protein
MEQKAPRKHKIIGQNRKCFEGSWSSGNINHLSRRRSKKQKALVHSQYRMQALLVKKMAEQMCIRDAVECFSEHGNHSKKFN